MIAVISMAQLADYDSNDGNTGQKRRFEKLTGAPVVSVHYTEASPEYLARLQPRAIFITGFGYGWDKISVPDLYPVNDLLHTTETPVYAACGGHQLVGHCFSRDLRKTKGLANEAMRKLRPGEPDYSYAARCAGYYTATGYQVVERVKGDPIFAGLRAKFRVREAHYCEVKKLPRGFELLATSPECAIEMMKHTERPIYSAQFHAESWNEVYTDGQTIMANFFRLAGLSLPG